MVKLQTQEGFINKSKTIFGDALDYSKVLYKNSRIHIILICKLHGEFSITPGAHISYKRGCRACSGTKHNTISFIDKAISVHGDKYDYSKVVFRGMNKKVIIVCPIHGDFDQCASKHVNSKQGCPNCDKSVKKNIVFVKAKAEVVHGNRYDYSKSVYVGMFNNIEIVCKKHGSFWQAPSNHIKGKQHCPKCAYENSFSSLESFITRATEKHGKYDYSKVKYIHGSYNVEIVCPQHGSFWQSPNRHLRGNKCPKCIGSISKAEQEWLDDMLIPEAWRHKTIIYGNKHFRVDAYDEKTNTIYEFYGDYWHGNPKIYNPNFVNRHNKILFGKLYSDTIDRLNTLIALGYKVVYVWEKDYKTQKKAKCQKKK